MRRAKGGSYIEGIEREGRKGARMSGGADIKEEGGEGDEVQDKKEGGSQEG